MVNPLFTRPQNFISGLKQFIHVKPCEQSLSLYINNNLQQKFLVSLAGNGLGELQNSEKTPRGWHQVRAKIGADSLENTVFVGRRATGEIYSDLLGKQFPNRDWILTRIMWLSGLEVGKNRLGKVDTMRRYIYIHGSPDSAIMGLPGSRGCIRMHNSDIIKLFNYIDVGVIIFIGDNIE